MKRNQHGRYGVKILELFASPGFQQSPTTQVRRRKQLHDSCSICCGVKVNRPEENGSQEPDSETTENGEANATASDKLKVPKDIFDFYEKMDRDEDDETELQTVSFEINQNSLEKLQKRSVTSIQCFAI